MKRLSHNRKNVLQVRPKLHHMDEKKLILLFSEWTRQGKITVIPVTSHPNTLGSRYIDLLSFSSRILPHAANVNVTLAAIRKALISQLNL